MVADFTWNVFFCHLKTKKPTNTNGVFPFECIVKYLFFYLWSWSVTHRVGNLMVMAEWLYTIYDNEPEHNRKQQLGKKIDCHMVAFMFQLKWALTFYDSNKKIFDCFASDIVYCFHIGWRRGDISIGDIFPLSHWICKNKKKLLGHNNCTWILNENWIFNKRKRARARAEREKNDNEKHTHEIHKCKKKKYSVNARSILVCNCTCNVNRITNWHIEVEKKNKKWEKKFTDERIIKNTHTSNDQQQLSLHTNINAIINLIYNNVFIRFSFFFLLFFSQCVCVYVLVLFSLFTALLLMCLHARV